MDMFDHTELAIQPSQVLQFLADNGETSLEDLAEELVVEEGQLEEALEAMAEEKLVSGDDEYWDITEDGLDALARQSLRARPHLDDLDDTPDPVLIEEEFASAGYGIDLDGDN